MAQATQAQDLNALTAQELYDLSNKAREVADRKSREAHQTQLAQQEKERKAKLNSPAFKKLKAKFKELEKRFDALCKQGGNFQLIVPIVISFYSENMSLADVLDQTTDDSIEERFQFTFEGEVGSVEGHKLSKVQRELLKPYVEQYVNQACGEIMRFAPPDTLAEFKALLKEVDKFAAVLDNQEEFEAGDFQ